MRAILSLYSGILGLDRPFHWHGFTTVAACDENAYCRHVIAHYLPGIPIYESDLEVTRERLRRDGLDPDAIAGVIGGPPCQPTSVAGQRLGAADRRWRWPEAVRVVGDVRPRWCVFEQPAGLVSFVMPDGSRSFLPILAALAALGYRVGYDRWPARAVGAPHERMRVAVIALRADVVDAYRAQWRPEAEGRDESDRDDAGRTEAAGGPPSCGSPDGGGYLGHTRDMACSAGETCQCGQSAVRRSAARASVGVGQADSHGTGPSEHADGTGQGRREQSAALRSSRGDGQAVAPRRGLSSRRSRTAGQQGRPDADERGARGGVADSDRRRCGTAECDLHARESDAQRSDDMAHSSLGDTDAGRGWDGLTRHIAPGSIGGRTVADAQSALGGVLDGLSRGLAHLWPAGRGQEQCPWEPARLVTRPPKGSTESLLAEAELEALGNAVVSQQFEPVAAAMAEVERAWEARS